MFFLVVLAYVIRMLFELAFEYSRGPYGAFWWFIGPPILIFGLCLVPLVLGLAFISARRAHHFAPAFVLLGGLAVVPLLPLPTLPRPVLPEQKFFAAHRAEFEQVVTLAYEDDLDCLPSLGCSVLTRELPSEYEALSINGLISVSNTRAGLEVRFTPMDFYCPVIYFESPTDSSLPYMCVDSGWVRKLDEHWYLCVEEWN